MNSTEIDIKKALSLKDEGKFEESLEILENLFNKDPDSEEIKKNFIDVLFAYGSYLNDDDYSQEHQKALELFNKIIEIDPNNYRVLYNIGLTYFHLGKMENALKSCNEALKIKPDYKHCYYSIGLIYEVIDDWKKALEYYEKALKIDPKYTYALSAKHHINQIIENRKAFAEPAPEENKALEQLKSLLKISKRIRIQMIQDLLKIENPKLLEILIDWGEKYKFEIDGDFLNINKDTLPELLKSIDNLEEDLKS